MHHLFAGRGFVDEAAGRVEFTAAARSVLAVARHRDGDQAVLLTWPAGATYLPRDYYRPGEFDVVVGRVEGCPIYADVRRLALFPDRQVVLDADPSSVTRPHPPLRARVTRSWQAGRDLPPGDGAAGFDPPAGGLARDLVGELVPQFAGVCTQALIWTYVGRAISDLRGSVTAGALPEMAARLAHHRLSQDSALAAAP